MLLGSLPCSCATAAPQSSPLSRIPPDNGSSSSPQKEGVDQHALHAPADLCASPQHVLLLSCILLFSEMPLCFLLDPHSPHSLFPLRPAPAPMFCPAERPSPGTMLSNFRLPHQLVALHKYCPRALRVTPAPTLGCSARSSVIMFTTNIGTAALMPAT